MAVFDPHRLQSVGRSSFGDQTANAKAGRWILDSPRYRDLDRKQTYYDSTQHDHKRWDFEGRAIQSGAGIAQTQPLMGAESAPFYVPLRSRRPSAPYRLSRVIVNAFTAMLFGENRFPRLKVAGDDETQDFIDTMIRVGQLPNKMMLARQLGGATGTAVISWCFLDGKPYWCVHNAKYLYVHAWRDRENLIPKHVTECYQFPEDEWDPKTSKLVRVLYWYRRDWYEDADVVFLPVRVEPDKEPNWFPDVDASVQHNDGVVHLEWIQNVPSKDIDGLPDYDGLYESFDTLDLISSVVVRGATLNLDPTLVLKMDMDFVSRMSVKKGSDNALTVGVEGDAKYMELAGTSIVAGIALMDAERKYILEVAQCTQIDPAQVTASGTSSVAMKSLYAPMLGKCDLLREQYGTSITRMITNMVKVAQKAAQTPMEVVSDDGGVTEVYLEINLPPRVETDLGERGEDGTQPEPTQTLVPRTPGLGHDIEPQWPPYFAPTAQDQQLAVTTLVAATCGAQIMSTQTATELTMQYFGRDERLSDETNRITKESKDKQAQKTKDLQAVAAAAAPPPVTDDPKASGPNRPPGGEAPPGAKQPEAGFPIKPPTLPRDTPKGSL